MIWYIFYLHGTCLHSIAREICVIMPVIEIGKKKMLFLELILDSKYRGIEIESGNSRFRFPISILDFGKKKYFSIRFYSTFFCPVRKILLNVYEKQLTADSIKPNEPPNHTLHKTKNGKTRATASAPGYLLLTDATSVDEDPVTRVELHSSCRYCLFNW